MRPEPYALNPTLAGAPKIGALYQVFSFFTFHFTVLYSQISNLMSHISRLIRVNRLHLLSQIKPAAHYLSISARTADGNQISPMHFR